MEHKIRTLTVMTAIALILTGCTWCTLLLPTPPFPPVWPGLFEILLSLGLLYSLASAQHRFIETLKAQHRQELESLKRAHAAELTQIVTEAHAEMDAFRSSLSHSLRMPVAIIQGYADLLSSGVVTDDAVRDEYLSKISERSQYMTEAITRQFSSVETLDSSKLHYSKLDLLTLVRQIAADMQTAAASHGVTIQVISSETLLPISADAYLLNRVLFNVLENALKYMGRPGTVTIRAVPEGENVSIRIQDDGMGLSAEETSHIFEPNYQGSNRIGGQGYGLYLVRRTVECHGGTISAQSAPGRGMGITMLLPVSPPQSAK
mgnify:FL=1